MTSSLTLGADDPAHIKTPQPGDVLGGKYRVEREIGSGGMGVVYEVTHLVMTKKRFAVKWLQPLAAADADRGEDGRVAARRFLREAEIAGRICHPHVVEVYDVTIGDSGCFMVMELLEGESLEARLKRDGRLPVPEACRIIATCASGVGAAHAAHVIHRDLKPANIFLAHVPGTEQSCPKVLDFGISRFTPAEASTHSTVTRAGTLVGTPAYMAPEQLRGFACDARTDVYALGVTLYEALSGQRPYDAPTYADLVVRIVTGDALDLRELVPALPAGLSAIVMRALHVAPGERYQSVQALADVLQPYADAAASTLSIPYSELTQPELPQPTPRRRNTAWLPGLAAGACALALAGAGVRWATKPAAHSREPVNVAPAAREPVRSEPLAAPAHVQVVSDTAPATSVAPALDATQAAGVTAPAHATSEAAERPAEAARAVGFVPGVETAQRAGSRARGSRAAAAGHGGPTHPAAASGKHASAKRATPSQAPQLPTPGSARSAARAAAPTPAQAPRTPKPRPVLNSL